MKLKSGALAVVLISVAVFGLWQHQQIKRLKEQRDALQGQANQISEQQQEIERLTVQLQTSAQSSETEKGELLRLRAQLSKLRHLEQENARLNIERQRVNSERSQAEQAVANQQKSGPGSATTPFSLPPGVRDLDVLELSTQTPQRVELGAGKECMVTTVVLDNGMLELTFKSESKTAEGIVTQTEQKASVFPDNKMIIVIGDTPVALTPKVKVQ